MSESDKPENPPDLTAADENILRDVRGDLAAPASRAAPIDDYIIDPRLDKDTANRLVASGVVHAPLGSNPAVAKWVADGYAKLPKGTSVPATVEFNDAPFIRNPKGVAHFNADRSAVELRRDMDVADLAQQAKDNRQTTFWSTDDEHHALIHEVAHYNHLQKIGKWEFLIAVRADNLAASDVPVVEKEVGRYAAFSKANFVAEVFVGKVVGKKYSSNVWRFVPQDGRSLMIGPFSEQCLVCKHLHRDGPGMSAIRCDAFPRIIPTDILFGGFDHTQPFPGDNGIHFEPIKEPASVESASS